MTRPMPPAPAVTTTRWSRRSTGRNETSFAVVMVCPFGDQAAGNGSGFQYHQVRSDNPILRILLISLEVRGLAMGVECRLVAVGLDQQEQGRVAAGPGGRRSAGNRPARDRGSSGHAAASGACTARRHRRGHADARCGGRSWLGRRIEQSAHVVLGDEAEALLGRCQIIERRKGVRGIGLRRSEPRGACRSGRQSRSTVGSGASVVRPQMKYGPKPGLSACSASR